MKKFIIILFAVFFTGCFAHKQIKSYTPKCNYYIDDIEKLYDEPFYDSSANGIVCEEKNNKSYITIKNGLAHGKAMKYSDNGTVTEYNFENGKRKGLSKTFENGIIVSSANFIDADNGEIEVSIYFPNGKLSSTLYLKRGDGKLQKYNINGNLIREETYVNGKKNGITKLYFDNGQLETVAEYKNDKLNGPFKLYNQNGIVESEGTYKDDKLTGLIKNYYENGSLKSEQNYQNDKLHGISKSYYKNGSINEIIPYKNGNAEGIKKIYYENGALKAEVLFRNDKVEGMVKTYYKNGAMETEAIFKKGKKEGVLKQYDENGILDAQVTYSNNKKNGQMKKYNDYGKLWATITYKNDNAVSGKCANGRKWNNAELSNWENGLKVNCGY